MIYAIEDIARTLKEARERKGLSQRALSARSGVHQYQISKIENGSVDLRLSSLIELARALDLDLKLIPRKAVPAVDNIVRTTVPKVAVTPAFKELNRTLDAVKYLRKAYPAMSELTKLQNSLQSFTHLQGIGKELETLREITRPVRELQKVAEQYRKLTDSTELPAERLQALRKATELPAERLQALRKATELPAERLQALRKATELSVEQLQVLRKTTSAVQSLRNHLAHHTLEAPSLPRPAYSLDDDDDG